MTTKELQLLAKCDETIEQLVVPHSTEEQARQCAKDALTKLAETLQGNGRYADALRLFGWRRWLTEPEDIRFVLSQIKAQWRLDHPEAETAHKALASLMSVLMFDENEPVFDEPAEDPTIEMKVSEAK